jgi:hypothetical protein
MTTQDDRPRDGYEDRLLSELRALAVANAAASEADSRRRPARARSRPRRRLALAGVAGGVCAASAVIALTDGGSGSTAYAVEPHGDGSVTVEISALEDAAGLERKLRAAGVPAEVDYLPDGKVCREPRFAHAPGGPMAGGLEQRGDAVSFTIDTRNLRSGQTLVISSTTHSKAAAGQALPASVTALSIAMGVAEGPVAPCEPVEGPSGPVESVPDPGSSKPAAPVGGAASGSGGRGTSESAD